MMRKGLQLIRCNCPSKAHIYFDGTKAYCPCCGTRYIIEWINGKPDGVVSHNAIMI